MSKWLLGLDRPTHTLAFTRGRARACMPTTPLRHLPTPRLTPPPCRSQEQELFYAATNNPDAGAVCAVCVGGGGLTYAGCCACFVRASRYHPLQYEKAFAMLLKSRVQQRVEALMGKKEEGEEEQEKIGSRRRRGVSS